jgi:hypothetical protein
MVSRTDTVVDRRVGEKPLFKVGEVVYTWNDVVARARATGHWEALEDDVRAGLAAVRELDARGEAPDEDDLEAAARAFRYGRGLLAGDELDAWLVSRGLTTRAWEAYLRRALALELSPEPEGIESVAADEVAAGVWAEGICSGVLEGLAADLATLVAVAPDAPADARDDEYDAFCAAAATDAAISREIESNRLEWVRVRYDAVLFPDEDSAAEAALCVRSDGDPLADVAARIGLEVEERLDWMDEVDAELASRFLAAEAGNLVGPAPVEGGFVIAELHEKTPPNGDDEDVRARAADAVSFRAASREVNERVTWLESF